MSLNSQGRKKTPTIFLIIFAAVSIVILFVTYLFYFVQKESINISFLLISAVAILAIIITGFVFLLLWKKQTVKHYRQITDLERSKKALQDSYESLLRNAHDLIFVSDEKGKIEFVNKRVINFYGYSEEEILKLNVNDIIYEPSTLNLAEFRERIKTSDGYIFERYHKKKDGSIFPVEVSIQIIEISGQKFFQSFVRDITERKNAESKITRLNRVYTVLSNINQMIVRTKDKSKLLEETCNIAVRDGGFRMVWIGMTNHETKNVEVVSSAGYTDVYLDKLKINLNSPAENLEPTVTCIITREYQICNDINNEFKLDTLRNAALNNNYLSSASFPLIVNRKCIGAITIYSDQKNIFTEDEIKLLSEMTGDVSYAIESIDNEALRIKVENALTESEAKYRTVYENSMVGIYRTTPAGEILLANPAMVRMFGYKSFEELANRNLEEWNYEPSYQRSVFIEIIERDGKVTNFESAWSKPDGTSVFVRENARVVRNENGKTLFYDGIVEDITEQKIAEETLRESEKRFKTIFDSINDAIFIHDMTTGEIIDVNRKTEEMYLYTREEIRRLKVEDLSSGITPYTQKDAVKWMLKTSSEGSQIFDWHAKDKNGRLFWVEVNMRVASIDGARRMLLVVRDITERKIAEEEIKQRSEQLSALNSLSNTINQSLLLDVVIQDTIDKLVNLVKPDLAFMFLREDDKLILQAIGPNINKEKFKDVPEHKVGQCMCGLAVKENKALFSIDIYTDMRCTWTECKNAGFKSFAALPLRKGNDVIGVIGLSSDTHRNFEKQSAFLETIAAQVSSAINNATLYKDLHESEELFKKAFKGSPDAVNINRLDDGLYVDINDGFTKITGYSREDVIGKTSLELDIWADPEDREKIVEGLKNNGYVNNLEARFRKKDGNFFTCLMSAINIEINGVPHNLSITRNIEEIVRTQTALRESEEKYRSLVEHNPDGIFIIDLEGNFLSVNKAVINSLGYSEEELLKMKFWSIVPTAYAEEHKARLKKIIQGLVPDEPFEYTAKNKNGDTLIIEVRSVPYIKEGKVIGFQGIARNITERKKVDEELLKLTSAIKQSPVSVIITDKFGNIEYVNPKLTQVSGYTLEEIKGKNPRIFQSGNRNREEYQELWKSILNGEQWSGEFYNKKKDGTYFWESASISAIRDKEGMITHFVAVKEDITDKKKTLEELIIAKEKAETANKTKDLFLANMSHELRTPLIGILGYSEMLVENLFEAESIEMANGIKRSGNRLLNTLNLLLDLTRIESDKFEMVITENDIKEELEFVYKMFRGAALEKKLDFSLQMTDDDLTAKVDPSLVTVILENLVNNAVKFTKTGGITLIAGKENSGNIFIKVQDTGIGINKIHFEKIFEEFKQVSEGINREFQGTGLGLAITKRYVEMLNGSITLESEIGKGSTFTVTFPSA